MRKLIFVLLAHALFSTLAVGQQTVADLILYNGKIFTSDLSQPVRAQAIAVGGERILAVGSNEEIRKLAGAKTRLIDLQGRTLTPGFNDAHFHFTPQPDGFRLQFKDMEPSWAEVAEAVKNAAAKAPKGSWIFGAIGGRAINDQEANRFALDKIAPDHPVYLGTYFGHGQIVNSRAMRIFEISDAEPDVLGGYFERDQKTKRVNGRIFEYAQWRQNRRLAAMVSDEQAIRELKQMGDEAVAFGVTSLQVMPMMPIERFVRLLEKADLPVRVRAVNFSLTTRQARDLSEIRRLAKLKSSDKKITVSGIKWILDGTPIERGAALRKDYDDQPGWRGRLNFSESEIEKIVKESLEFDQPLLLHCVGDRACAAVFDAMDKIGGGKTDWKQKRVRVEHGEVVVDDLLERAAKLGVVIVQNPTHFTDGEMGVSRWGGGKSRIRSMIETGVPFALGSDGPMNPFLNVMLASIHPDNPSQAITREQAVRAYTFGSAYAEFAEKEKGTLAAGKLADFAVLSQDIFTAPVPELPKTQSVLTVVGGKIVHDAEKPKGESEITAGNIPAGGSQNLSAEEQVLKLNREYSEMIMRGDAKEIERVLADDYIVTDENGNVLNKAQDLATYKNRPYTIEAVETLSQKAREIAQNVFVINTTVRFRGVKSGKPFDLTEQTTTVWALRNGRWQVVSDHFSFVKKE